MTSTSPMGCACAREGAVPKNATPVTRQASTHRRESESAWLRELELGAGWMRLARMEGARLRSAVRSCGAPEDERREPTRARLRLLMRAGEGTNDMRWDIGASARAVAPPGWA